MKGQFTIESSLWVPPRRDCHVFGWRRQLRCQFVASTHGVGMLGCWIDATCSNVLSEGASGGGWLLLIGWCDIS